MAPISIKPTSASNRVFKSAFNGTGYPGGTPFSSK
eukprot:CAMPEP_0198152690 /NCGR_PEP_ID=MMETSP1443-20131203/60836_1 /TAXON_ID=186043 /ORGANISM="Entomoneis sp., Strain CCMP2396" /LENGTH=34 /DNA_ID= /DNA_START= /DNA_END= /DNA_ORIENTATION=